MLKMMAADNDDAYNLTPAFILETVASAKFFVANALEKYSRNVTGSRHASKIAVAIKGLLDWPIERIEHALAQLSAIEEGDLSKKAVESVL